MMSAQGSEDGARGAPVSASDLAASIAADETTLVGRHFASHDGEAPTIIWSPRREQLGTPVLQTFYDVCDQLGGEAGLLAQDSVRLEDFDGLDRWMMVLSLEDGHYRYTHYGEEISNHYGEDMTGRSTADFEGYIATFFAALYSAARQRRERVLSVHEPPARVFVRAWRRLIVPVIDDGGDVAGFVAANVPENDLRAGLDMIVDPVLVTDRSGVVQYFNQAANDFFGIGPGLHRPLQSLTGLEFPVLPPPELLLARRDVVERIELVHRKGGVLERLAISVSAAEYRGRAFYVFHIRDFPAA